MEALWMIIPEMGMGKPVEVIVSITHAHDTTRRSQEKYRECGNNIDNATLQALGFLPKDRQTESRIPYPGRRQENPRDADKPQSEEQAMNMGN